MRFLVSAAFALLAQNALADLYRWIDPETGSVKFSSYPPPWYGDPELEKRSPKVEHIPERKQGPAAAASGAAPDAATATLEALEAQRKSVLQKLFSVLPGQQDFQRAGAGIKQQLEAYGAVIAELDRLDPRGAEKRRMEAQPLMDKLIEGLRAQLGAKPPPAPGSR